VLAAAEAALGGEPERFMGHLDDLLRAVTMAGAPVAPWQGVISVLRRHVLPPEGDAEALARMEDLWQQARVLIGEVVGRVQVRLRVAESERTQVMREVGQTLLSSVDVEELLRSLARQMPRLEIPRFFLALYEYAPMPLEGARLLFAYDDGVLSIPEELRLFPTRLLVPDPFLPADERFSMVVEPLYFRDEQLGYAFFDAEPWDAVLYDLLQEQISSALRETLLVEQVERRAAQIETASEVARAASRVRDPDVLIQRVVDLVRGRFDLYYVGLFLVDETGDQTGEPGRWAVLRAGTGEAGDRMMAEGHRLEVGGDSMIGTSVAEGQAQVALDVGDEAVRFENPLLPDTHSELALPLVSRGRVIGALSIQSSRRGAFSEDDIRILQTMASQLGIAIENARLLERTQRALSEMETTHRQYLRDSWAGYLESESTTRYEVERPGVQITFDDELLAAASRAARGETVVVEDPQGGGTALVAPIHLRGEVIGALHVEDDGARKWNEDDRAILAAVVDRLALVAESLRLLQETQERAGRERLIGELTARMRETLDVDTVLQTAAVEIRRSLGLHDVLIRLEGGDGRVEGETERKDAGE
jgi:GAF domain-containing protein